MSKPFTITKQEPTKDTDCAFDVHVEISADELSKFRAEAVKSLGSAVKVAGFREGKVPEKIIIDRMGEVSIIEEAGQLALEKNYTDILAATKLHPIGSPSVLVTKVAAGEPFAVKINISTIPEVKLADYKKIAKETFSLDKKAQEEMEKKLEVTDKEIEDTIKNLQDQVAHQIWHDEHPEDHNHDHGKSDGKELDMPAVDEAFIKRFGDFKTVDEFKAKIADGMKQEKGRKEKEKARLTLMESLIEKSEIKLPRIMVEAELDRMLSEMDAQVSQMGMKLTDYLKHINKTIDDVRTEWEADALKRAKTQVIMNDIAIQEKIEPNKEEVEKEVEALMNYYKDADRVRSTIYVEQFMSNDLVWKYLEGLVK